MGGLLALDVGAVLAAVFLLVLLLFAVVSVRRWLLERNGGTIECSLRTVSDSGAAGAWRLGVGSYKGDELHWYQMFGLRARPRHVLHRRGLVVSNRRRPEAGEVSGLPAEAAVIELRDGTLTVELAMGSAALTGFLAWLEAAPPGFPVDHIT
ncbi:MAG TPA: DUF2550 domain-containing protein [Streptosporangiaceae bacterium]